MRRAFAAGLAVVALAGCGAQTRTVTAPLAPGVCDPALGHGTMGACTPKPSGFAAPRISGTVIPDVSEYQACALRSAAIYRAYEAGTDRQDSTAACHSRELKRIGGWRAAYFFARGYRGCNYQADRFTSIVRALGGVNVYVIDAEVPLPHGLVSCLERRVSSDTGGGVVVDYTSTGTTSGGPLHAPLWLASYGARPGCIEGRCSRVAWQFSSSTSCRGVYGDCSVDEGILSLGVAHGPTPAQRRRAAKVRSLAIHRGLIGTLHANIERHSCRPGRQVRPPRYRGACGQWLREGKVAHSVVARLERELA